MRLFAPGEVIIQGESTEGSRALVRALFFLIIFAPVPSASHIVVSGVSSGDL